MEGEEGIDYIKRHPDERQPEDMNNKKLEAEIRAQLDALEIEDPIVAKELKKRILEPSEVDEAFAEGEIPIEEVKFYPGSEKGLLPEDDPDAYSRWFYENQAPSTLDEHGTVPIEDLGGKRKFMRMVHDVDGKNEMKLAVGAYLEKNEDLYPMQNYKGQPEFEMYNRENYNVQTQDDLPQITFMSNITTDELAPQHNDNTLDYQKLHPELERWAIFRSLPQLMEYDRALGTLVTNMAIGQVIVPQHTVNVNPPTLLSYYMTMPKWAREHSLVTHVFYAMEYHQTRTSIRDKELAMNFAASFLRPIDTMLMNCIKEVAAAKKVRLNVELGKQMMNELKFYSMDIHELGELSEDESKNDEAALMATLTKSGIEDDDEMELSSTSIAEKMFEALDDNDVIRDKERRVILDKEQNIAEFNIEPEAETCQVDFYRKPYAEVHEIAAEPREVEHVQMVDYWDNDDGFWDEYLDHRLERMEQSGTIVNRKFFKHW